MRAQMTITELTDDQWWHLQTTVKAEYKIPEGVSRLCLTFTHGDEERHVEMPMGDLIGLLMGISMAGLGRRFREILDQVRVSDLGIFLNRDRS